MDYTASPPDSAPAIDAARCPDGQRYCFEPEGIFCQYPVDICRRCGAARIQGIDAVSAVAVLARLGVVQ